MMDGDAEPPTPLEILAAQIQAFRADQVAILQQLQAMQTTITTLTGLVNPVPPPVIPVPLLPPVPVVPAAPVIPIVPAPAAFPVALTPLPKRFSGDPAQYKQFIMQCRLHYLTRPDHFGTDAMKVSFMLMLLEGNAMKWATPYIERNDPLLLNHGLFLQEFGNVFEKQYHMQSRRQEFLSVKQGATDVITYVAHFQTLAAEAGWLEDTQIALFHQGLKEELKDTILMVEPLPTTLNAYIGLALKMEHRLGERRNRRKPESRLYPVPFRQGSQNPVSPGEPMVLGAERAPLTSGKGFLCFYCGQSGHLIRQCPIKPPSGNAPATQEGGS